MKNVNVFCEFWYVINELKCLGYDIRAHKIYSTNECIIMCKQLINSSAVDIIVDYFDEWYQNSTTDEDEHVQGFSYRMRVNKGIWYNTDRRHDLFEYLKCVSEYK